MDMRRIVRGCVAVLRYVLAAAGTFMFLAVLSPVPFLKDFPEEWLEGLFVAMATAAALPIVLGGELLLRGKPKSLLYLYIPGVLWVVLTAVAVAFGTFLPVPWPLVSRVQPPLGVALNICFAAALVPPLTFWVFLRAIRWFLDFLAAALPKVAPYLVRV